MMRDVTGRAIAVGDRVAARSGGGNLKLGTVTELMPKTARIKFDDWSQEHCIPYGKCCVYEVSQMRMEEANAPV